MLMMMVIIRIVVIYRWKITTNSYLGYLLTLMMI